MTQNLISSSSPVPASRTLCQSAVSRQAIYDTCLNVWAYEVKHADPLEATPMSLRSDDVTSALILSAFAEFGLQRVVGPKLAFINASMSTLNGNLPLPIPSHRVTLQVRDYDYPVDALLNALRHRKDEGFGIALDDFVYTEDTKPLLNLVDYVKLDVTRLHISGMRDNFNILQDFAVKPIATRLENSAQVRACEAMGYQYFQGNFLFKPQVMQRRELPSSFVIVSDLLSKLRDPDVEFSEIEALVKRDPGLSVAVLRFLNSSAYGFRQEVASVRQAVALLGLTEFSKWALLVVLSARFEKPPELITTALIRARCCENLAKRRRADPAEAFMIGLLSVLDALLDTPMYDILEELPVTSRVKSAILELIGPEGEILSSVMTREHDASEVPYEEQEDLSDCWLEAVEWADRTHGAMRSQRPQHAPSVRTLGSGRSNSGRSSARTSRPSSGSSGSGRI